jgi:hypothetical protein
MGDAREQARRMRQAERAGQDRRRMQRVFDGDLDGLAESTLPMFVNRQSGRPVPAAEDLMWARRGGFVPDVLLVPSDGEEDAKAAATWQLPGTADQGVVNMAAAELAGRGRLVVSRGTILPSGPLTLPGKHLHGMGASEATVLEFLSWTGGPSADLLEVDELSGVRLKIESAVAAGKSLWPAPFTSPDGDYRWAVRVNRLVDCRIAGTVYLGPSGHGYASHVRCSGMHVGGGGTRAVGVTVDGPEGLWVAGGDVQLVGVSVTQGETFIAGGRCYWRGREARKVTTGAECDIDLGRSGELVVNGGQGYVTVRQVFGDVTVNGGENTLTDMWIPSGNLTLNNDRTRLLQVRLGDAFGSGSFVDNGHPYFACGSVGIPNTCDCGGGSGAHGHTLDELTDVDLAATPVTGATTALVLDGSTWKRGTVASGGGAPDPGVGLYAETVGDGTATVHDVVHGLDSTDVLVQTYDLTATPAQQEPHTVRIVDTDTVRVVTSSAVAVDGLRVVVVGGVPGGGGPGGAVATGGVVTTFGGYTLHMFPSGGTFAVLAGTMQVDVAVVAGGGSGGVGGDGSGGGGAGGVLVTSGLFVSGSTAVVVGDGAPSTPGTGTSANGSKGQDSSFGTLVATGGGYGSGSFGTPNGVGGPGGSGGGAGAGNGSLAGGAGVSGQGHDGGTSRTSGTTTQRAGGGGGGAGAAGQGSPALSVAGAGGAGTDLSAMFGTGFGVNGVVGGGGGGAAATSGVGGAGGGGAGVTAGPGVAGLPNTGGGGGAASHRAHPDFLNFHSGAGGSGIVIVRYPTP